MGRVMEHNLYLNIMQAQLRQFADDIEKYGDQAYKLWQFRELQTHPNSNPGWQDCESMSDVLFFDACNYRRHKTEL